MPELSVRPFTAGDIGYMIHRQTEIFEEESHFTSEGWRGYISDEVHEFADRFDPEKDCAYILEADGVRSGCIAVIHRESRTAQLRFLFVEPGLRRTGIGNKLFEMAVDFCRSKGYERAFLWTVGHLEDARRLYARNGFRMTEAKDNKEWGTSVREERWDLDLIKER
jgi:GNAT superfamily N-acetyltransferase